MVLPGLFTILCVSNFHLLCYLCYSYLSILQLRQHSQQNLHDVLLYLEAVLLLPWLCVMQNANKKYMPQFNCLYWSFLCPFAGYLTAHSSLCVRAECCKVFRCAHWFLQVLFSVPLSFVFSFKRTAATMVESNGK